MDCLWKYAAFLSFEFWTQRPVLCSSYFLLAAEPRDLPGLWENFVRSWFMNNWTPARDILVREVHMLVLRAESIVDNPCKKDLIGTYFKLERLQYTRRSWYCTEKKRKTKMDTNMCQIPDGNSSYICFLRIFPHVLSLSAGLLLDFKKGN